MNFAKNIRYLRDTDKRFHPERHLLDIYFPESETIEKPEVLIFFHGGTWTSGDKNYYEHVGHILAWKNMVVVVINFSLAPEVHFDGIAQDCAYAVKWVYKNIDQFGGNPEKISLCGYSSGGHLAALITLNPEFFNRLHIKNIVQSCVLIDAFGLCLEEFRRKHDSPHLRKQFYPIFTDDPENWIKASPVEFIDQSRVPFLILTGENTHLPIRYDNKFFANELSKKKKPFVYEIIKNKNHIQMASQLKDQFNPLYEKIIHFVKEPIKTVISSHNHS